MKKISIVVPCYNEKENVENICNAIISECNKLKNYDYDLMFIDNNSTDGTRDIIKSLCSKNKKVKAIFNLKNFGQFNSPFYGLCQTDGDCTMILCADFQDPVELIPTFVKYWEEGYQVVCGVKTSSQENKLVYFLRSIYYKLIKKFSNVDQIEHFTGFALYDKSFIDIMRNLNDPTPFLRGIVAEFAYPIKLVEYVQPLRQAGRTHNNCLTLYDAAMLSFTSYTKIGIRLASFVGIIVSIIDLFIGLIYLVLKIIYWDRFVAGMAPLIIIITLMCSVILVLLGFIGEYISAINQRMMNRPLVVEKERINM